MSELLIMTKAKWLDLKHHGQYVSGEELILRLDAAMTEVDLDEILGEWIGGVVADGGKPFSSHVLAHIKEGQHGK